LARNGHDHALGELLKQKVPAGIWVVPGAYSQDEQSVAVAVVAGSIIVAATMAVVFRYEVTPVSTTVAHRFDRWTGQIQICTYQKARMECSDD